MSTTILERARDALSTLGELVGLIPRDLRSDFERAGFRLAPSAYAPVTRRMCTATTAKGTACRNRACANLDVCMIHHRKSTVAAAPIVHCSVTTAKGTPCKCRAFRGFEMCATHAKKQGLITVPTDCAICYEDLTADNKVKTACGHYFHRTCLEKWAESRGTSFVRRRKLSYKVPCPMCRKSIIVKAPRPACYTWGEAPPTFETTGAEGVTRLDVVPVSPMMTPEQIETGARNAGRILLTEYIEYGTPANPVIEAMTLGLQGLVRRV
jgi:hypothetical protein